MQLAIGIPDRHGLGDLNGTATEERGSECVGPNVGTAEFREK